MPGYKNTKFLISILIVIFGVLNYMNAQRELFIPHSGYSLQLQKKQDLLFSISGFEKRLIPETRTVQAQIGYSPVNHLGISIFHSRYKVSNSDTFSKHHHFITGIHISTYFSIKHHQSRIPLKRLIKNLSKNQNTIFNFSSGYSNGQVQSNYSAYNNSFTGNRIEDAFVKLNLQKFYLQGGMHLLLLGFFQFSGSYKLGKVNYYKGIIDGQNFRGNENDIRHILDNRFISFKEFSFKEGINGEIIGLYFQQTGGKVKGIERWIFINEIGLTIDIATVRLNFLKKKKQKELK